MAFTIRRLCTTTSLKNSGARFSHALSKTFYLISEEIFSFFCEILRTKIKWSFEIISNCFYLVSGLQGRHFQSRSLLVFGFALSLRSVSSTSLDDTLFQVITSPKSAISQSGVLFTDLQVNKGRKLRTRLCQRPAKR